MSLTHLEYLRKKETQEKSREEEDMDCLYTLCDLY